MTTDILLHNTSGSLLPSVHFLFNHALPGAAFCSARLCSR